MPQKQVFAFEKCVNKSDCPLGVKNAMAWQVDLYSVMHVMAFAACQQFHAFSFIVNWYWAELQIKDPIQNIAVDSGFSCSSNTLATVRANRKFCPSFCYFIRLCVILCAQIIDSTFSCQRNLPQLCDGVLFSLPPLASFSYQICTAIRKQYRKVKHEGIQEKVSLFSFYQRKLLALEKSCIPHA